MGCVRVSTAGARFIISPRYRIKISQLRIYTKRHTLRKSTWQLHVQQPTDRTYGQYCPIAAGLDLIGDRWTLLILRELSMGDRRFTDLRSDLPGSHPTC